MKLHWIVAGCLLMNNPSRCYAAVESLVESFSGEGPYGGFDNPGWQQRRGQFSFRDGGLAFENYGFNVDDQTTDRDRLEREVLGIGSFAVRAEIAGVNFGRPTPSGPTKSAAGIRFIQLGMFDQGGNIVAEVNTGPNWTGPDFDPLRPYGFFVGAVGLDDFDDIPRGERVAVEVVYDSASQKVTFHYDGDFADPLSVERKFEITGIVPPMDGQHTFLFEAWAVGDGRSNRS